MGGRRPLSRWSAAAIVLVAACTSTIGGHGSHSSTASSSSSSAPPSGSCDATYAAPDPQRPRMTLSFAVKPDLSGVTGSELVTFTPDLPITELVFRLTANTMPSVVEGNSVKVTSASADHQAGLFTFTRANADPSTQGGLLHIPFPSTIPAGTTVHAQIGFELTLGVGSFDRFGRVTGPGGQYAWFGSGEPLLAWERGYGWHEENMIDFVAESATSEAMDVELSVTAPAADTVIMSGDPTNPVRSGADRVWHSTIATARDVSVAVGPFVVSDTTVGSVHVRIGAYSSTELKNLIPEFHRAINALVSRYGPFPFPSLSVARVPAEGGGIEYPSSILLLDASRFVIVHETSHQWFYAMVGDSQALHPWLDEAFATYSEQLVDNTPEPHDSLTAPGRVDRSTESYGRNVQGYYFITYSKGAAALEAARTAAGPAKFDAALRCYVAANAWRIANPPDLAKALQRLPAALAVLREAGSLP